jgi:hypothetical protein
MTLFLEERFGKAGYIDNHSLQAHDGRELVPSLK